MGFKQNTAADLYFTGVHSSTGAPTAGLTWTGYLTVDGGAQGAANGSFTNLGNGQYRFAGTAADFNGAEVGLMFTAASTIPVSFSIKTDTKIVSELNDFDAAADEVALVTLATTTTTVSNEVTADVTKISGGTTEADRLQAALGTGNYIAADLQFILNHQLTDTGTQLADGFEKFFDVSSPTGTVNSLADAVPGAAGGGFIAGTNAQTTITTSLITGAITLTTPIVSDMTHIHGTALTETATQLAGAFTKFFDVGSPTGTVNSLPDAIPGNSNALITSVTGSSTNTYDAMHAGVVTDIPGTITTAQNDLDTITGTDGALISTEAQDLSASLDVNTKTITANAITATAINADAITEAKIADNAIAAEHIAAAAIDNATFAADVGSTAYATNIIALAVRKSLDEIKLDHLVAIADADDAVNDSLIAKLAATGGDWSTFVSATDSLQAIRDRGDAAWESGSNTITKNTALTDFPFFMVLTSDHVSEATGLSPTATRSIDGAAFGAAANSPVEIANGWYKIDLDASDLNGDTIALRFAAATADTRNISIATKPGPV